MKKKYYPFIPIIGIFLTIKSSEGLGYMDIFILSAFIQAVSLIMLISLFFSF